jgi:hypothetical protein
MSEYYSTKRLRSDQICACESLEYIGMIFRYKSRVVQVQNNRCSSEQHSGEVTNFMNRAKLFDTLYCLCLYFSE